MGATCCLPGLKDTSDSDGKEHKSPRDSNLTNYMSLSLVFRLEKGKRRAGLILYLTKGMCGCQSIPGMDGHYFCHQRHFPFYSGNHSAVALGPSSMSATVPLLGSCVSECVVLTPQLQSWLWDSGLSNQTIAFSTPQGACSGLDSWPQNQEGGIFE